MWNNAYSTYFISEKMYFVLDSIDDKIGNYMFLALSIYHKMIKPIYVNFSSDE